MTGLHMVADVHCADCREVLGWKYEKAYEDSQKYKEGKVVLEKYKIVKENWQLPFENGITYTYQVIEFFLVCVPTCVESENVIAKMSTV